MVEEIKEKINFTIPLEVSKGIVNADGDVVDKDITDFDTDSMIIEGLASSDDIDLDNQILKPSGFILDYFLKSGFINYNHQTSISPDAIIGEPTDAKVTGEKFFLKAKLYSWSNLARNVYTVAKKLEEDKTSDRTLGFSLEGLTLETKDNLVSKMLLTGCAVTFVPKNNSSWARIVKGITLDEVRELRKGYLFSPIGKEKIDGVEQNLILNIPFGDKQLLVNENFDFVFRENPILNNISSLEEVQKAIILISQGVKEGFIKKERVAELKNFLSSKIKELKLN